MAYFECKQLLGSNPDQVFADITEFTTTNELSIQELDNYLDSITDEHEGYNKALAPDGKSIWYILKFNDKESRDSAKAKKIAKGIDLPWEPNGGAAHRDEDGYPVDADDRAAIMAIKDDYPAYFVI